MIRLSVNNSISQVTGVTAAEMKDLKALLSYLPDPSASYFSGGSHRGPRYLIDKRGTFPTGLLYLVQTYLANKIHETVDSRKRPLPQDGLFKLNLPHTPYPEQKAAAEACRRSGRGIVVAPTGVGKSVIAALIIHRLQVPTLIVVPSLELKDQLTKSLATIFGEKFVGGVKDRTKIAVENVGNPDLKLKWNYNCVIIDEFHHSGAKTYRELNKKAWTDVYYKFGLTATPFRSQDHERLLLESVLSEVIYEVDYFQAVEKGYIVPLEAYYIELPRRDVEGYTWAQVYNELVVNNKHRNAVLVNLLLLLKSLPTLCLVKEIAHGEALTAEGAFLFANGKDGDANTLIKAFNSGKVKTLIGTTGVVGEGVDTKPAEYVIIAGLGKSKNAFMQQVGRGFRRHPGKESCKIIIFKDNSHKWTKAHFAAQVKYLKDEYGVVPVKLELA